VEVEVGAPTAEASTPTQGHAAGTALDAPTQATRPHWSDTTQLTVKRIEIWLLATIVAGWDTARSDWFRKCEDAISPDGGAPGFSERMFLRVWKDHATDRMRRKGPRPRPGYCPSLPPS